MGEEEAITDRKRVVGLASKERLPGESGGVVEDPKAKEKENGVEQKSLKPPSRHEGLDVPAKGKVDQVRFNVFRHCLSWLDVYADLNVAVGEEEREESRKDEEHRQRSSV